MTVDQLCPVFVTPWTVARQAPLSMEFSRQEYWSRLPFTSPGNLPNPGIQLRSPAFQVDYHLSHTHWLVEYGKTVLATKWTKSFWNNWEKWLSRFDYEISTNYFLINLSSYTLLLVRIIQRAQNWQWLNFKR